MTDLPDDPATATIDRDLPIYLDATRSTAERIDDLVARMTLDEKAAQLGSAWVFQVADGTALTDQAGQLLLHGIGQITRISGASGLDAYQAARLANTIQRHLVEHTRLGIPAIVHEEICSGLMAREAAIFPQALGLAATWEPALASALADAVRGQMRAMGAHQGLSPVLDVCRDPRWGRTEETFGEDPHLVAQMGLAFVRGLQGDDPRKGVIATAKHFVGYGASEGGMNWAPAHLGERELRDVHLHPFEAVVRAAGVGAVMNAYQEIDGVPVAADARLLTTILREEWGFTGMVVSDYFAIRQLAEYHGFAADADEAAAIAFRAGLDVELPGTDCYGEPLLRGIASGAIPLQAVDASVRRVLQAKIELGLFEQPYVDEDAVRAVSDTPAQRQLAATIARQSIVLLRNDGVLPIDPSSATIAVIGPNADEARHLLGDYTYPAHVESLLDLLNSGNNVFAMPVDGVHLDEMLTTGPTIRSELHDRFGERVSYAQGCGVAGYDRSGFAAAVDLAAAADVAVLVMGDKAGLRDDCTSGESRDVASLDLPGVQEDLAHAVVATGTPTVLVMVAGRPYGSARLHESCAAVVHAWLPGPQGAGAVADVLCGAVNPGGRLPLSYPRHVGQIPIFYGHKVSGGRSHWKGDYVDLPSRPLYPFGHGLSYTTFALTNARVERDVVASTGAVRAQVTVSNTGERDGDEVVQLYVRDPAAAVTRPVLELKGFARVRLAPGETKEVVFTVPVGQLGYHDRDLVYAVDPGRIDVMIGSSSVDLLDAGSVEIVTDANGHAPVKAFEGAVAILDRG